MLDLIGWDSDAPAVTDHVVSLTYRELDRLAGRIAAYLVGQGVTPGERVLLCAPLSAFAVAGMLGVLRAGAQYVPVDTAFPPQRRRLIAEHSQARVTLTPDCPLPDRGLAGLPGPYAYTCFTSGSTGVPKPVTIPMEALRYSTLARHEYYKQPVSTFLLCSSISFDSSVAGIYWTLTGNGHLVIPSSRPASPPSILAAARRYAPSHTLMVPSLYRLLLRDPAALKPLRVVVVAGEPCPPGLVAEHFAALPETALYNEYGPTEATVWATVHRCRREDTVTVPIGRPIPGTDFGIRDGELWLTGPGVAAPTTVEDGLPWYRTGDRVTLDAEGLLHYQGRGDNQLKLGGVRLELAEIERALQTHPNVESAAVAPSPRLTAFVVARCEWDAALETSLRSHLLLHLPAGAVPRVFVPMAQLPTLPNGKLDRRSLRAPD